jgi:hypothetical protein
VNPGAITVAGEVAVGLLCPIVLFVTITDGKPCHELAAVDLHWRDRPCHSAIVSIFGHAHAAGDRRALATMKMRMGATHFLMKTLPKVATEMALCVLTYNLTRVLNTVGVPAVPVGAGTTRSRRRICG